MANKNEVNSYNSCFRKLKKLQHSHASRVIQTAKKLKLPIRFIGVGESIDDLRPFDATEFVEALFSEPFMNRE